MHECFLFDVRMYSMYPMYVCMYGSKYVCMYVCMYLCMYVKYGSMYAFNIFVLSISIFPIIGSGGGLSEESKAKLASLLKKLRNSQDPAAIPSRPCPPLEGLPVR